MRSLNTLQGRIVLSYTSLIVISVAALSIYIFGFVLEFHTSSLQNRLEQQTALLGKFATQYFQGDITLEELKNISQDVGDIVEGRTTVIAVDGKVIVDSWEDPNVMDNHLDRPEIQDAMSNGTGKSTRYSTTVKQDLIYTAILIKHEESMRGITRIAIPKSDLSLTYNTIIATIAFSSLLVISFSIVLGFYLARRTSRALRAISESARRLARGEFEGVLESNGSEETRDLAEALNSMARELSTIIDNLSAERDKLSAVLNTMDDGVIVIRQLFYLRQGEGIIELINPAAEELLQLSQDIAIGQRFMETLQDHELQDLVSSAMDTQVQKHTDIELLQPRIYVSATATPLIQDDNNNRGVLLVLHDLTRIRRVDVTRKQFVSNVSHELRSPLAAINAMVETLEDGALEDSSVSKEFIRRIHHDVDRMRDIVEELLELSRLESGHFSLEPTDVDPIELIQEIKSVFQEQANNRQISLNLIADDNLQSIRCERGKIYQVLYNLVDNSLKFTPEGGNIQISTTIGNDGVVFEVSDTGIGIPLEDQPHVFERFYRVNSSRQYRGTGLGLSIARHIVEAHGGTISLTSSDGNGSVFGFNIPVRA